MASSMAGEAEAAEEEEKVRLHGDAPALSRAASSSSMADNAAEGEIDANERG